MCAAEAAGDGDSNFDEYNPNAKRGKEKANTTGLHIPQAETVRAEQHTLTEHHDHLLSASFDLSYHGSGGAIDPSSSQAEAAFGFDDNFFAPSDALDIGALADELERELGWGVSPTRGVQKTSFEIII
jgi:meiotic recombination protein REC8